MTRRNRFYFSFHHRKKLFYVISSMILSSVLLFTGLFDIMVVTLLQNPNLSTHKFMKTAMVRIILYKSKHATNDLHYFTDTPHNFILSRILWIYSLARIKELRLSRTISRRWRYVIVHGRAQ